MNFKARNDGFKGELELAQFPVTVLGGGEGSMKQTSSG